MNTNRHELPEEEPRSALVVEMIRRDFGEGAETGTRARALPRRVCETMADFPVDNLNHLPS